MANAPNAHETNTVGLDEKVAVLRAPATYPEAPDTVHSIETHMAWVFLTGTHAYKLKKPVAYDELDFTTLARRQWACSEEVRLNRRLAGAVYRGVVPLCLMPRGALRLGDGGEVVDWLVKMRQLPAHRMLDACIERGAAPSDALRRSVQAAVRTLARFYADAAPVPFDPAAYVQRFHERTRSAAARLVGSPYRIARAQVRAVFDRQHDFLQRAASLLEQRAQAGRIVEGHGDLRPEHVCLTDEPVIFDCIEFDRTLRLLDPVDELSFLGLECAHLEAPSLGPLILDTYAEATGDAFPAPLVHFYQSCRALERAQIAVRHTRRPGTADEAKWAHQARAYLHLAADHVAQL